MQLTEYCTQELEKLKKQNLYRQLKKKIPAKAINFSSNNYLGKSFGAGASRLVSGSTKAYIKLETEIAKWKKTEKALVFPTGYMANLGSISCLMKKGDLIIIDKLDHASIIDACYLSGADLRVYKHKDMEALENILKASEKYQKILIVTESVFSMDGDKAPLKELAALAKKYNVWTYVDEAHAVGVFGKTGAGLCEELHLENEIDIKMGTLSKAAGGIGGYIAGPKELIDYLINRARSFIYTTGMPEILIKNNLKNLKQLMKAAKLRKKLWNNIDHFYKFAKKNALNITKPESAIIPVVIGDEAKTLKISETLQKKGIILPAIRYPTVPKGKARLRCTITAAHSKKHIEYLIRCMI